MKLHWCCGDIYLDGYVNIDIAGQLASNSSGNQIETNKTDLAHYFKFPFIEDPIERRKNKRPFIVDKLMNILEPWEFDDNSVDELVMISCIEHFDPVHELPHILAEMNRVIKVGGKIIVDFPDLKKQFEQYYESNPEFYMELVYCNHKNKFSIHHWGFNEKTFPNYLGKNWSYEFKTVVQHDYPMIGVVATKVS